MNEEVDRLRQGVGKNLGIPEIDDGLEQLTSKLGDILGKASSFAKAREDRSEKIKALSEEESLRIMQEFADAGRTPGEVIGIASLLTARAIIGTILTAGVFHGTATINEMIKLGVEIYINEYFKGEYEGPILPEADELEGMMLAPIKEDFKEGAV